MPWPTPTVGVEVRHVLTRDIRRTEVVEARAEVERQTRRHAPVVLHEPLDLIEPALGVRFGRRLGVAVDRSEQRVGEPEVGVERVAGVAVEVEVAVEHRRARRRTGRVLEEDPRLHVVPAGNLRQVRRVVPDDVAGVEGIAIGHADAAGVREGVGPAVADLGHEVLRVGAREELWQPGEHHAAIVAIEVVLRDVTHQLFSPVPPDRHLAHRRGVERVQQRAHHAERADFVRGVELRPAGVAAVAGAGPQERIRAARVHFVPELHAGVERRIPVDVVVDARHLVVARLLEHILVGVVVLAAAGRIGRVRQREQVQHPLADRVDAVRRNLVVREAARPARIDVARQPLRGQVRIPDPAHLARAVERLREVPRPLQGGRHGAQLQRPGVVARQEVLREEEEQLVTVAG